MQTKINYHFCKENAFCIYIYIYIKANTILLTAEKKN